MFDDWDELRALKEEREALDRAREASAARLDATMRRLDELGAEMRADTRAVLAALERLQAQEPS